MRRMVRARVCDPLGPRWLLSIVPAVAAGLIVLAPLAPATGLDPGTRVAVALVGVAALFARRILRVVPAARGAALRLDAGAIAITEAGILNQRVRAWDVVASSTARTAAGSTIAIVRRGARERPLLLDFDRDDDLDAVRRTLGLGHLGFGEVAWPTRARGTALRGSGAFAFAWFAIAMCAALDAPLLGFALALVIVPATVVAALVSCLSDPRRPCVALTSAGLRVSDGVTAGTVHYADVVCAHEHAGGVFVATGAGSTVIPMPKSLPEERRHLAAQLLSAAARARGEGPSPPTLPAPLARLAPRSESERSWLQRIDAAAASIASVGAYRGGDLDPKDLWDALESPDAPVRVRAAAARVLARVCPSEAETRVARALASSRDAYTRSCIRVALDDDVDGAARDLENLARRYHPET
jgi:hypothetical protein